MHGTGRVGEVFSRNFGSGSPFRGDAHAASQRSVDASILPQRSLAMRPPAGISGNGLRHRASQLFTSRRGAGGEENHVTMENEVTREQRESGQTIIIQQAPEKPTNSMGTAGFVLALLGLIFSWVPVLGWILWLLGLIFSIVGVLRRPRGLAIAGLAISCVALILLIVVIGAIASLAAFA